MFSRRASGTQRQQRFHFKVNYPFKTRINRVIFNFISNIFMFAVLIAVGLPESRSVFSCAHARIPWRPFRPVQFSYPYQTNKTLPNERNKHLTGMISTLLWSTSLYTNPTLSRREKDHSQRRPTSTHFWK